MRRFRDLDSYEDAEIMRKRVEACVTAIVYGDELEEEGIAAKVTDANGNIVETMEPGLIAYARGGKEIEFNTPSAVGGYAEFKRCEIQSIAAATGLTYELLSGDLSRVNYFASVFLSLLLRCGAGWVVWAYYAHPPFVVFKNNDSHNFIEKIRLEVQRNHTPQRHEYTQLPDDSFQLVERY
jgi:hypothetical protein